MARATFPACIWARVCYNEIMSEKTASTSSKKYDSHSVSVVIICAAITIVLSVIGWEGWKMLTRQPAEVTATPTPSVTEISQQREQEEDYIIDESQLENEISEFMTALGIDDPDGIISDNAYTQEEIRQLDLQYPNRTAPPAGQYVAIHLYEQGVEKNLDALSTQGKTITLDLRADHSFRADFLGINMEGTYDNQYGYIEHVNKMPIFWNGTVLTIFAHRLQVEMVPNTL